MRINLTNIIRALAFVADIRVLRMYRRLQQFPAVDQHYLHHRQRRHPDLHLEAHRRLALGILPVIRLRLNRHRCSPT